MSFLSEMHCVVPGCLATSPFVRQWRKRPCLKPEHAGKTHQQCSCPEPRFYHFPTDVRMRMFWLQQVKRPHLQVTHLTKVCSRHFKNPNPDPLHHNFPDKNLEQGEGDGKYDEFRFPRFTYKPEVTITRVKSKNGTGRTPSTSLAKPTMLVPIKTIKTKTAKPKGATSQAANLPSGSGSTATTSSSGQEASESIIRRIRQLLSLEPSMGAERHAECGSSET